MDTYENELIPQPEQEVIPQPEQEVIPQQEQEVISQPENVESPYACPYTIPQWPDEPKQIVEPRQSRKAKKDKKDKNKSRAGFWITLPIIAVSCLVTGLIVNAIWQNRLERMEQAMDEKFAVLEKSDSEQKPQQTPPVQQIPSTGPLTPSQVYAKNVDAVVAVNTRIQTSEGYGEGFGSGFVISADGYVVTNYHVIEGAKEIAVIPHGGKAMKATIVGTDSSNDVALLKVEGENMPHVTLGSSDALVVGDQVMAIGNPLGELTATLTVGYISAKDRIVNTDGTVINMLQTDAAINSGNSGGPLFDMNGNVVGITTAKYSGNSQSGATIEGLGFAIPMDDVTGILSDLKEFGYVTGAYLGVYVRDVDASAQSYGLPAGAYVEEAIQGYCAKKGGIRTGDIIVNLGGYDVDSITTLTRVLRRFKAGESVSVTVYRSGRQEYLTVVLDEKPTDTQQNVPQETQPDNSQDQEDNGFNWFDFFAPFF